MSEYERHTYYQQVNRHFATGNLCETDIYGNSNIIAQQTQDMYFHQCLKNVQHTCT